MKLKTRTIITAVGFIFAIGIFSLTRFFSHEEPTKENLKKVLKAITLSVDDEIDVQKLESFFSKHQNSISSVFLKWTAAPSFSCSLGAKKCHISVENKNQKKAELILGFLKDKKIPVGLIYDININSFEYKFHRFQKGIKKANHNTSEERPGLFSLRANADALYKDLDKKTKQFSFESVFIGSELNIYFYLIKSLEVRSKEIEAFWKLLEVFKTAHNEMKVASVFQFEHMKNYNFWSAMGRERMAQMDLIGLSSFPLDSRWQAFKKFDPQLYTLPQARRVPSNSYYNDIGDNLVNYPAVYVVDFAFPSDESGDKNKIEFMSAVVTSPFLDLLSLTLRNPKEDEDLYFKSLPMWDKDLNLNSAGLAFFK